jgi:dihydroorotate dehydrogenase
VYRLILKPLLFALPAETAHHFAFGALRALMAVPGVQGLARALLGATDPASAVRALGLVFPSPVLLAAGFDKNALGIDALGALGFGGVEIGTVTHEAQPGNPQPRLFRLPRDRALVNRMGFNNDGAAAVAARLARPRRTLVGVNIGKTKRVPEESAIADYVASARLLAAHADYFVVNVSSPNTPGLRDLQAVEKLRPLLRAVQEALEASRPERPPPLLVKIAPDLSDDNIDEIADLARELGLAGIIATNTTIARTGLVTPEPVVAALGAGGLSGAPLGARSLAVLRRLRARCGDSLTLIAAGGIESVDDAWQRLQAGATLVQVYTAFVYEGPLFAHQLARGLAARQRAEGATTPALRAAAE